ncbi:MAG: hypothetical protein E6K03_08520 [Methanobacteriota archaeon]|nr:MAG: hypothetical protein E6K03_08520 [Euryarchaeota archaeon]
MAGLQALILLIVIPAIAWAVALLVLRSARAELARESAPESAQERSEARMLVHLGYSGTPVLLGLVLYALARPGLDAIDRGSSGGVVRLEPLVLWASFAYAFASCSTLAAQTWIVKSRLRAFLGSEFGRVLPLWVVPATGLIFALILVFLVLAYVDSVLAGVPVASDSAASGAISSFQAFALGTVAFPVAAGFSNRVRDLNQRGFMRAILIMEVGELPVLVGLVQTFLALGSL